MFLSMYFNEGPKFLLTEINSMKTSSKKFPLNHEFQETALSNCLKVSRQNIL